MAREQKRGNKIQKKVLKEINNLNVWLDEEIPGKIPFKYTIHKSTEFHIDLGILNIINLKRRNRMEES